MQPEQIIGQLLGALVGRKRSRRSGLAGRMLGRRGGGGVLAGGTLLTVAGLVWGALESMQKSTVAGGPSPGLPPAPGPAPSRTRGMEGAASPGAAVPPPLPGVQPLVPPPLPGDASNAPPAATAAALPLLRLAISAAHADGELSDDERSFIRAQAATLGIAAEVEQALRERTPLDTLTAAFTADDQRRAAYALAWAVIHGDGMVSPGERMYLTQLGRALRLSHEDVETIEREALAEE